MYIIKVSASNIKTATDWHNSHCRLNSALFLIRNPWEAHKTPAHTDVTFGGSSGIRRAKRVKKDDSASQPVLQTINVETV